jgi:hypothetical protein
MIPGRRSIMIHKISWRAVAGALVVGSATLSNPIGLSADGNLVAVDGAGLLRRRIGINL